MKNLAKTIVIPAGSVENFVDFSDLPGGRAWFGQGVSMAAHARHAAGYFINYPHSKNHVVIYCRTGSYVYEYGALSGTLRPNGILAIPAGACQTFGTQELSDCLFFLLEPEEWGDEISFLHKDSANSGLLATLMEAALKERGSFGNEFQIRRNIASLILSLLRQELSASDSGENLVDRLCGRIRLRPELSWTIEEMAEVCGVSPSYLFSMCRKLKGESPYEILTRIRMELAGMLLEKTDYPIKVIAPQCGYQLPFSFTRTFSKHMGISPAEYRKRMRQRE